MGRGISDAIRFNFAAHETPPDAPGILARYWAHKMQHFFNLDVCWSGPGRMVFSAEVHREYTPPLEAVRMVELDLRTATRARVRQIQELLRA